MTCYGRSSDRTFGTILAEVPLQFNVFIAPIIRTRDDNPCAVVPTAGGKTPIMASICKDAVQCWNDRVLILAHVKELLEQTADKLHSVCPELEFGVHSAGLRRRDTDHPVIVAGIQSVYKRACELGAFDLVMVDECCLSTPPEGQT
jgi:DNA repair protein RadD